MQHYMKVYLDIFSPKYNTHDFHGFVVVVLLPVAIVFPVFVIASHVHGADQESLIVVMIRSFGKRILLSCAINIFDSGSV